MSIEILLRVCAFVTVGLISLSAPPQPGPTTFPIREVETKETIKKKNFKAEKPLSYEKKETAPVYPGFSYGGSWVEQCKEWARAGGVHLDKWALELIFRESKCNPTVWNHGGSGACGIPQALPCSKLQNGIHTDPVVQLQWMERYVLERYGSWQQAVYFHNAHNWY